MRRRPVVIRNAADVPQVVVDAFTDDIARRLSGTPEARACVGLSFTFISRDARVLPVRYEVGPGGVVRARSGEHLPATFTFVADATTFDSVLRGRQSVLLALLQRHIRLDGSFLRVRALLAMMPAVQDAYAATRARMCILYRSRYSFAF